MANRLAPLNEKFHDHQAGTRNDQYLYHSFFEEESQPYTLQARQVHAASYRGEGFINDEAIDESGIMVSELDKARGDSTQIYLGFEKKGDSLTPISTLRKISIPLGSSIEELPGFDISQKYMYEEERDYLRGVDPRRVKEIAAFGHVPEVDALAGMELLRKAMQDSIGTGDVWFFTMVAKKHDSLVKRFGPKAVRRIGDNVTLNDPRVENIELVPTVVDTDSFFQNILDSILIEQVPAKRRHYTGTLVHFAEGLEDSRLPDSVVAFLQTYHDQSRPTFDFTPLLKKGTQSPQSTWTRPEEFNLDDDRDRGRLSEAFDTGMINETHSTLFSEELAEMKYPIESQLADRSDYQASLDAQGERYGRWFLYPWSKRLVHFPELEDFQLLRTLRNRQIITDAEQATLFEAKPLIAGLSVGRSVLDRFLHGGTGGSYVLADFDTLSVSNLNRINAGMHQVGDRKIDLAAKMISELDPYITQEHLDGGIDSESLASLSIQPSILIDEVDDLTAKALLRMYAKEHRIPLMMVTDVGENTVLDIERYDNEDVQLFNGRLKEADVSEIVSGDLTEKRRRQMIQKLVGVSSASLRLLETVQDPSIKGFPQPNTSVASGSADLARVANDILLGRNVASGRIIDRSRKRLKLPPQYGVSQAVKLVKNQLSSNR